MTDEPKRVRLRNREDGTGLEVTGLEHALVRRVVLVADPLEPPRVFLELLGHELDVDVAALVVPAPAPARPLTPLERKVGTCQRTGRRTFPRKGTT